MNRISVCSKKRGMYFPVILFVVFMLYIVLLPDNPVRADDALKFEKKSHTMYEGNVVELKVVPVDEGEAVPDAYLLWGTSFKSSNENVARVDSSGTVTCVGTGTATITLEGYGYTAKTKVKVKSGKCTLSREKSILYKGESLNVRLKNKKHKAVSYFCEVTDSQTGALADDAFSICVDDAGKYSIEACEEGEYRVRFILKDADGTSFSKTGEISVLPCGLSKGECSVACGDTITADMENCSLVSAGVAYWFDMDEDIHYTDSEEEAPVIIDDEDELNITGLAEGMVYLDVVYDTPYAEKVEAGLKVYVTNPQYEPVQDYLWVNEWTDLKLSGVSSCSEFDITAEDEEMLEIDRNGEAVRIMPKKTGKCKLYITADGVDFDDEIEAIAVELPDSSVLLAKGEKYQCRISGIPEGMKLQYTVSDEDVLKVSKKGKVTAKGYGISTVYVEVAERSFSFVVNVGTPEGIGAAKYAADKVGKASYSQGKRMEEGYYDCSSLAWRSYASVGVYIGNDSYAPTAADLAKYLADNGCVIEMGETDISEVLPGDLIFSTSGGDNGRYLKIDHVGIYYGASDAYDDWYYWYWFGDDDAPEYSGTMVHAGSSGQGVYFGSFPGYGKIVMTARPVGI